MQGTAASCHGSQQARPSTAIGGNVFGIIDPHHKTRIETHRNQKNVENLNRPCQAAAHKPRSGTQGRQRRGVPGRHGINQQERPAASGGGSHQGVSEVAGSTGALWAGQHPQKIARNRQCTAPSTEPLGMRA